jgi:hypothetical protein
LHSADLARITRQAGGSFGVDPGLHTSLVRHLRPPPATTRDAQLLTCRLFSTDPALGRVPCGAATAAYWACIWLYLDLWLWLWLLSMDDIIYDSHRSAAAALALPTLPGYGARRGAVHADVRGIQLSVHCATPSGAALGRPAGRRGPAGGLSHRPCCLILAWLVSAKANYRRVAGW